MNMPTQELIENAVLDAHGLLDEPERASFERSLAAASPEVQALVRREQTRFAAREDMLPDVEPPVDLRRAVIERVREEMARTLVASEHSSQQARSLSGMEFMPSRRVSPFWRMAAVASLAAAVALAFGLIQLYDEFTAYEDTMEQNAMLDEIAQTFGSRFVEDTLFDPQTERAVFSPAEGADGSVATGAQASIWYNPDWDRVRLFSLNLDTERSDTYRLAVLDADGNVVRELHSFEAGGGLDSQEIPMDIRPVRQARSTLALIRGGRGPDRAGGIGAGPVLRATLRPSGSM